MLQIMLKKINALKYISIDHLEIEYLNLAIAQHLEKIM